MSLEICRVNDLDLSERQQGQFFLFIMFFLFFCLCIPVEEIDFFWHLATGEWILHNGKLPEFDPFSNSFNVSPDIRDMLILKGYWLSQTSYALLWKWFGAFGIVFLRSFLICSIFYLVYRSVKKEGRFWLALAAIIPILIDMRMQFFLGERPQQFTFVFTCLLFYLLNKKNDFLNLKKYFLVFALMAIWSNFHQGVLIGIIALFLYAVSLIYEFYKRRMDRIVFLKNISCVALCIFATMINPNGWNIFSVFIEPFRGISPGMKFYMSFHNDGLPLHKLFASGLWQFYGFIVVILISLITLILKAKRMQCFHLMLLLALLSLSLFKGRYMVFLTMLGLPLVIPYWQNELARIETCFSKKKLTLLAGSVLLLVGGWVVVLQGSGFISGPLQEDKYPKAAVEFIKNTGLSGNIFNPYGWGGYLIAFLPGHDVFIDGRGLGVNQGGHLIESAIVVQAVSHGPGGKPMWKAILDQRNIDIFIAENSEGWKKIAKELLNDPGWKLVFQDKISYVFLRR